MKDEYDGETVEKEYIERTRLLEIINFRNEIIQYLKLGTNHLLDRLDRVLGTDSDYGPEDIIFLRDNKFIIGEKIKQKGKYGHKVSRELVNFEGLKSAIDNLLSSNNRLQIIAILDNLITYNRPGRSTRKDHPTFIFDKKMNYYAVSLINFYHDFDLIPQEVADLAKDLINYYKDSEEHLITAATDLETSGLLVRLPEGSFEITDKGLLICEYIFKTFELKLKLKTSLDNPANIYEQNERIEIENSEISRKIKTLRSAES